MISLQFLITALIVTQIPGTGVVYTMSTVYIRPLKKWIRLDARGNKAGGAHE